MESTNRIVLTPHRIAITGASSTGKTTLAEALIQHPWFSGLVKTMIPEGSRALLQSQGHAGFDSMTREELRDFQRLFFVWKREAESKVESYLVDRSFVDVAAIWMERDTFDQSLELQNELVLPCKDLAKKYTLHIHAPGMASSFHHNGVRESDLSLHRRIAVRVAQYLNDWKLPHLSLTSSTLDLRVREVRAELERRSLITPPA
ncbi:MAG TPA: AAA family ATPase [Pyrinomonadaceae bacterium]|nr:AAA family ATPase [Pyrinomonadaceae bacterium]